MPNNYNLSEGALQIIMKGGNYDEPIMQVLSSKKVNSGAPDKERLRIWLSDGKHTTSFAMLTTQTNDVHVQACLEDNTIIKIKKHITSAIMNAGKEDARVLMILELELLHQGKEVGCKIGNPVALSDTRADYSKAVQNDTISSSSTPGSSRTDQYNLSEGALEIIMKGGNYDEPIMQVLASRKINTGAPDKERFGIVLSDGKHTISFAMLDAQANDVFVQACLENNTIIKIKKHNTSVIENAGKEDVRVLLILKLELLHQGKEVGCRIGNPVALSDKRADYSKIVQNDTISFSSSPGSRSSDQYNLSEGALEIIMKGGNYDEPIMQVLASKKLNPGAPNKEHFRILLSDGKHTTSFAMFSTQINDVLAQACLENNTIIKIKIHITSVIKNPKGDARVLLILQLELLHQGKEVGCRIGNPVALSDKRADDSKVVQNGTISSSSAPGSSRTDQITSSSMMSSSNMSNATMSNSYMNRSNNQSMSLDNHLTVMILIIIVITIIIKAQKKSKAV